MCKLINELYTNPKQSNHLLQIGLPADSADCYRVSTIMIKGVIEYGKVKIIDEIKPIWNEFDNIPCWSVGRLIGIYEKCTGKKFVRTDDIDTILEDVLYQIKFNIENTDCEFNFSKLEI